MKKTKSIIATLVVLTMINPLAVLAAPIGSTVSFGGNDKPATQTNKTETTKNPTVTPGKPSTTPSKPAVKEQAVHANTEGTKNNPYIIYTKMPYTDSKLKSSVSSLMKKATVNSTLKETFASPIKIVSVVAYYNDVPNFIDSTFTPFYIKAFRSYISMQAVNKQTKKTTTKDDYYNWNLSGPVSWDKNTNSANLTITFTQPGKYKLTFLPYEERTNTISQTVTGTATEVWPTGSGKSTTTLYKTTTSTGPTKTIDVAADMGRRQVWILDITSSDINRPIPFGPSPTGGGGPSGGGSPSNPNGSSRIEVLDDIDVTIVE